MASARVTPSKLSPEMTFAEAAELFIMLHSLQVPGSNVQYRKPRTVASMQEYARAVGKLFAAVPLKEVDSDRIHAYHEARATNEGDLWHRPAGANKIIQEVTFLRRVMTRAGAWTQEHDANYIPLRFVESDIPCALSAEEQAHWLAVALTKPDWSLVYLYSIVAFATGANHIEMRQLRRCDINLFNENIEIRSDSAKNRHRIRTIPLDPDSQSRWALERLLERAHGLGSVTPSHCVFPFRRTDRTYDPTRPMSSHSLQKKWNQVRAAAGLPDFTPKDTRHTAITRWAESGMALHVMMAMAGHVNPRMTAHYVAVSEQAKKRAMRAASRPAKACVTAATNGAPSAALSIPSLIKRLQRAGLSPDAILAVIADTGEGSN